MFGSSFEKRVKDLAGRAGLKIADINSSRAKLLFTVNDHTQPLWIFPYEGVWEFSCPSIIALPRAEDIPSAILIAVLEQNAREKRGFWCLERINGEATLEYMHNMPDNLLTPQEFSNICWGIVREVEALEQAFRSALYGKVR